MTDLQKRIICFLAAHEDVTGEHCAQGDVSRYFELPSVNSAQWALHVLRRAGYVTWNNRRRSLKSTAEGRRWLGLPAHRLKIEFAEGEEG